MSGGRERNCQDRHDQSDQGEGNFLLQLYLQPHRVEATLLQVVNVAPQFLIIHLRRLLHFLLEVAGVFAQFVEGCDVEGAVILDGCPVQGSRPTLFKDPLLEAVFPVSAFGVDAARELEGIRVKLEDRNPAEVVGVGIEHLVIVNFVALSQNPLAVSLQISLGGLALDLVAQDLLFPVGVWNIDLVENEQPHSKKGAEHNYRKGSAIDAHSAGLHGRQLARLFHQPEGNEHGEHDRQRRNRIDERRAHVPEVLSLNDRGDPIAHDVGQQFEVGEDQHNDQTGGNNHRQVQGEVAQDHVIQDQRETGAETALMQRRNGSRAREHRLPALHGETLQLLLCRLPPATQSAEFDGHLIQSPQQKQPAKKEEDVARPDTLPGRHLSLTRHRNTGQGKEVVDEHQQNGEHKTCALAPFARRQAEWNAHHCQHQAGRGKREAALKLNLVVPCQELARSRDGWIGMPDLV